MSYLPHTDQDISTMLARIGVRKLEELFVAVPAKLQKSEIPEIKPLAEQELLNEIKCLATGNSVQASFLGGGSYAHYIPAVIKHLISRSEFYTAYTPYQPEISQGTLTAIYEYQSMICELTGLDVSNASLYDGASAVAEAALLAASFTKKNQIILANPLSSNYKTVLNTYCEPRKISIQTGTVSDQTAAVIYALPDSNGVVADYKKILADCRKYNALFILVADPHLLAVLEAPGKLGVDIVVGNGQPLGIPQSFGGPGLGFIAVKEKYLRFMPGRIVGKTVDIEGKDAFVLTMQTREQHIRREKATSNICSNQALCALMATIYLSVMGPKGLQCIAKTCKKRVDYAKKTLGSIEGFKIEKAENFKEFILHCPEDVKVINEELLRSGIIGGLGLGNKKMLVCCTELTTEAEINLLAAKLKKFMKVLA